MITILAAGVKPVSETRLSHRVSLQRLTRKPPHMKDERLVVWLAKHDAFEKFSSRLLLEDYVVTDVIRFVSYETSTCQTSQVSCEAFISYYNLPLRMFRCLSSIYSYSLTVRDVNYRERRDWFTHVSNSDVSPDKKWVLLENAPWANRARTG